MKHRILISIVIVTFLSILNCGGGGGSTVVTITVDPATVSISIGETQQFTAADENGNDISSQVTWAVTGEDTNGMIDTAGLYTSPDSIPTGNTIEVTATSGSTSGSATITLSVGGTITFTTSSVATGLTSEITAIPSPQATQVDSESGSIYILLGNILSGPTTEVYLYKSEDSGETFSQSSNLQASGDAALWPDLVLDSSGNLDMAYWSFGANTSKFFRSTDGGSTSSTPTDVGSPSTAVTEYYEPNLAIDSNDNIYMTVLGAGGSSGVQLYLLKSTDSGSTFSSIGELDSHDSGSEMQCISFPDMAIDSSDNVYIAYGMVDVGECGTGAGNDNLGNIYIQKYDGSTFSRLAELGQSGSNMNPRIAVDSEDNLHVVWSHQSTYSTGEMTVYYANSSDDYATETALASAGDLTFIGTDSGQISYVPVIVIDPFDNVNVAYFEADATNTYLNTMAMRYNDGTWQEAQRVHEGDSQLYTVYVNAQFVPYISMDTDSAGRVYITSVANTQYTDGTKVILGIGK